MSKGVYCKSRVWEAKNNAGEGIGEEFVFMGEGEVNVGACLAIT
jgi:hypothetical protein